jgi:hypothetical protein
VRRLIFLLAVLLPLSSSAESSLPFLKDMAGDRDLPRPWGLGIDFFTMDQDYDVKDLTFALPGVSLGDPSQIKVENEVQHFDIKGDVWLLPFLNVFGIIGKVDIDTYVDFSNADISNLPIDLGVLPVSFDGTVYGGGFTLAYGTESWFTSLTTTFTSTDTSGDFKSSVDSTSVQPRIGLLRENWRFWVVPFEVELESKDSWNYAIGAGYVFNDRADLSFEAGFGDRTHTLFNLNVRF